MTLTGQLSPGQLISFHMLFRELSRHLWDLLSTLPTLIEASAGARRISEIMSRPLLVERPAATRAFGGLGEGMAFENVSFSHDDAQQHLDQVSLHIPRGRVTAFVGATGSGKSTALLLLLGVESPGSGRILIGGVDLRELPLTDYLSKVGAVFQDSLLFHASVGDNILSGCEDASREKVINSARAAEIDTWIESLPEGYDSLVTGDTCSGGQRQRIALARALIREPELLVLDEPTSALDTATAAAVMRTLRRTAEGRTVILVTHQLRDAAEADHICVFERGRVVEVGSHAELMDRDGVYAALWSEQNNVCMMREMR